MVVKFHGVVLHSRVTILLVQIVRRLQLLHQGEVAMLYPSSADAYDFTRGLGTKSATQGRDTNGLNIYTFKVLFKIKMIRFLPDGGRLYILPFRSITR